jgi:hypothetical protein
MKYKDREIEGLVDEIKDLKHEVSKLEDEFMENLSESTKGNNVGNKKRKGLETALLSSCTNTYKQLHT